MPRVSFSKGKSTMKIFILCEDQAKMGFMDKVFLAEHGLSIFIDASVKILFDLGATDVFLRNAQLFGIDLRETDYLVISHGHWDHVNGLRHFPPSEKAISLVAHPGILTHRFSKLDKYNGVPRDYHTLTAGLSTIFTKEPFQIMEDVFFLGEIPRMNDFESQQTYFTRLENNHRVPDYILDDSALAVNTPEGLVVISGCAHAGICNTIEHAKKVAKTDRVRLVVGGFHLLGDASQLEHTIRYFHEHGVELLCPMHCTDLAALCGLANNLPFKKLCSGDWLELAG
ncbi:MAG TPA: MBL fold metallo-hydrolase [Desulfonatronum sp.]|nr:MBL fold metallo-hydrolase [Desulfonatronum sp.]